MENHYSKVRINSQASTVPAGLHVNLTHSKKNGLKQTSLPRELCKLRAETTLGCSRFSQISICFGMMY